MFDFDFLQDDGQEWDSGKTKFPSLVDFDLHDNSNGSFFDLNDNQNVGFFGTHDDPSKGQLDTADTSDATLCSSMPSVGTGFLDCLSSQDGIQPMEMTSPLGQDDDNYKLPTGTSNVHVLRQASLKSSKKTMRTLSARAQSIILNNNVHQQFAEWLPFLTQRAPIKNENGLFDNLQYLIDDCIMDFALHFEFVCARPTLSNWNEIDGKDNDKQYIWSRVNVTATQACEPCICDVYMDRRSRQMFILEFVDVELDFNRSPNLEIAELCRKGLSIPHDVDINHLLLPLMSYEQRDQTKHQSIGKRSKKINPFQKQSKRGQKHDRKKKQNVVSLSCERRIWSLILLVLVNRKRQSPDLCYCELFMEQSQSKNQLLLDASVQSLLFFCAEHDQLLEKWLHSCNEEKTRHLFHNSQKQNCDKRLRGATITSAMFDLTFTSEERQKFTAQLFAQINQKSLIAIRKQKGNRIGKFKGRQHDKLLCITINGVIGFQLTFAQLFKTSLLSQLIDAQKMTCDTEINYDDLVTHLPFVFPRNFDCNFGSNFLIKTPYMETTDPIRMFGPISNMLWPDVTDIDTLVTTHLKTFKIEVEIICTAEDETQTLAASFVRALGLGPNKPYQSFQHWVSIVNHKNEPLGIFYYDPTHNIETARMEFTKQLGIDAITSEFKNLEPNQRLDMHIVDMTRIQYQQAQDRSWTSFTKHRPSPLIVPSQGNVVWKGNRQRGFAVRRFFKNSKTTVHVFTSLLDFIQREANHGASKIPLSERMFVILDAVKMIQDPSFVDNTTPPISFASLKKRLDTINFNHELVVVDDIGMARYYLLGHISRSDSSPQYKCCEECDLSISDNYGKKELPNYVETIWFEQLRSMGKPSRELQSTEQFAYSFMMSHDAESPNIYHKQYATNVQTIEQCANVCLPQTTFRCTFVGAVHDPNIRYYNTYAEVKEQLLQHAISITRTQGSILTPLGQTTSSFELEMPSHCTCCVSETIHCINRIGSALLVLDLYKTIETIGTTISDLQGKLVETVPFKVTCGLRCSHDWTNGSGDVFFRNTFHDHSFGADLFRNATKHVLVIEKEDYLNMGTTDSRVLVLV